MVEPFNLFAVSILFNVFKCHETLSYSAKVVNFKCHDTLLFLFSMFLRFQLFSVFLSVTKL